MSRVLVTVADGQIAGIDADDPHTIIYVRSKKEVSFFDGSAEQADTIYLRPEEMDVLLLAGTLEAP